RTVPVGDDPVVHGPGERRGRRPGEREPPVPRRRARLTADAEEEDERHQPQCEVGQGGGGLGEHGTAYGSARTGALTPPSRSRRRRLAGRACRADRRAGGTCRCRPLPPPPPAPPAAPGGGSSPPPPGSAAGALRSAPPPPRGPWVGGGPPRGWGLPPPLPRSR